MTARVLLALIPVGLAAAVGLADTGVGRYPPAAKATGSAAAAHGQPLTRGSPRPTRPRGDSFVPGIASSAESAGRVLPPFRSTDIGTVSDRLEVVFYAKTRPVRLTVVVATDGKSMTARWEAHLAKLFAAFDRDHDGFLNRHELEHIFPVSGVRQIFQGNYYTRANGPPPEMAQIDRDGDGRVSLAEFVAYYQEVLPALVTPKASPGANGEQDIATTELFDRLDQDGDGKLSEAELRAAEKILLALDADEDECVSVQEVLSNPTRATSTARALPAVRPPSKTVPVPADAVGDVVVYTTAVPGTVVNRVIRRYDKNGDYELTRDEVGFDAATFDRLDTNHDGKLSASELDIWRTGPPDAVVRMTMADSPGACKVAVEPTPGAAWPAPAEVRQTESSRLVLRTGAQAIEFTAAPPPKNVRRQLVKEQVNGLFPQGMMVVEEKDLAGPQSQFLRVVFDAADFDGDGKLTRAEFEKYFDLQASTAELGLVLSYVVRTPNLFQMLDDNMDGKLGVRELRTAWDRLIVLEPAGATAVTKAILQPSVGFRLTPGATAGFDPTANAGMAVPGASRPTARGPLWFRKMDRNGDGDVSRAEFLGTGEDFAMLDMNKDGLISVEEAEVYEARVRPKSKDEQKK